MFFRYGAGLVVVAVSALSISVSAGCKSGDSDGGSGGTGGSTTAAPVILPPTNGGQSCQSGGGSCDDQAAIDAYADCVVQTCDAEYEQCFGADYANGNVGGACGDLLTCAMACQDCDQACLQDCSNQHFTGTCKDCIIGPIATCAVSAITSGTCALPCGPTTGTGGACEKLQACCGSLTGDDQTNCNTLYGQVKIGGDAACTGVVSTYKQNGLCP